MARTKTENARTKTEKARIVRAPRRSDTSTGPEALDSDIQAVHATGRIQRLYFDAAGCYVRLTPAPAPSPKHGYFRLELAHKNYNALVSLLLLAVSQGYSITLRTRADIKPTEIAVIIYAVIDF